MAHRNADVVALSADEAAKAPAWVYRLLHLPLAYVLYNMRN